MTNDPERAFQSDKKSFAVQWAKVINDYCKIQNPIQKGRFDSVIGCKVIEENDGF
jgi:hypothetical protein